jgi:hypothetical protein
MNLWDKTIYLLCYGYENEGEGQEGEINALKIK